MVCDPTTSVSDIKKLDSSVIIRDASGKEVTSGNIGTGYTIKHDGNTYTVVKKGDTNGDGRMTPSDSTVILKAYVGSTTLSDAFKLGADTNGDGKITPADSTVVLRTYVGLSKIEI